MLSCGHVNIHSFLDKDTTGKDFRDDKQPSRSIWSEFAFIDKSCSRRALLRRRSWLAASASCSWKIRVKFSSSLKSISSIYPSKGNLKWVGNRGLIFTSYMCVCFLGSDYSLVDKDTTGNDFLEERHPSRSIWREFDLIPRSCSSLALLRSKSWLDASASLS